MLNNKALDDFILQLESEKNEDLKKRKNQEKISPVETAGLSSVDTLNTFKTPSAEEMDNEISYKKEQLNVDSDKGFDTDKLTSGLNKGMEVVASGMKVLDNLKGNQFNTDPDGAKPGGGPGAVIQGAMDGMQLGKSLGGGPITQGIGLLAGGVISAVNQRKATKEWVENKRQDNLNEDYLAKKERENQYMQEKGMESLENLKALRKKQLGL